MKKVITVLLIILLCVNIAVAAIENPFGDEDEFVDLNMGEFVKTLENETLAFSLENATGAFRVDCKDSDAVWYSSPPDKEKYLSSEVTQLSAIQSVLTAQVLEVHKNKTVLIPISTYEDSCRKSAFKTRISNGIIVYEISFPAYGISMEMRVIPNETGFTVKLDTGSINEKNSKYLLKSVQLLPFFGAGTQDEDGELLMPDGSGALIRFNNGQLDAQPVVLPVYGENLTATKYADGVKTETARLPLFGIIKQNSAFLSVITKGAASAAVTGSAASIVNQTNYANASFELRARDVFLFPNENKVDMDIYQKTPLQKTELELRYTLISKPNPEYIDLAGIYHDYLKESKKAVKLKPDMYLEIIGASSVSRPIMGVPVLQKQSLTTFTQTKDIVKRIMGAGVQNLTLKYINWSGATMLDKMNIADDPASLLGGKNEFNSLLTYAEANGVSVYLDANPIRFKKGGHPLSSFFDFAQTLRNIPAKQYEYDLSTQIQDDKQPVSYLLTKSKIAKNIRAYNDRAVKLKVNGISVSGSELSYVDYRQKDAMKHNIGESMEKALADITLPLMVDCGNDYQLLHAAAVLRAPVTSSGMKVYRRDVPFYHLAVHGLATLAPAPINENADYTDSFLKSVETGSALYFTVMDASAEKITGSYDKKYFYANFGVWEDKITQMYRQYSEFYEKIYDQKITAHERLGEDIYKTVYENRYWSVVNYTSASVSVNGQKIGAKSFIWGEGASIAAVHEE